MYIYIIREIYKKERGDQTKTLSVRKPKARETHFVPSKTIIHKLGNIIPIYKIHNA
jgi:hypothetical protein